VNEIVDQLKIARFSVVGVSAGGPHALVCGAHPIAERIVRIGVVSGMGPVDAPDATRGMSRTRRVGVFLGAHAPFVLRPLFWLARNPSRNPERFVDRHSEGFSASDHEQLHDPAIRALRVRSYAEATRGGVRGFAHEVAMLTRPWGFALGDVTPEVRLWHGEDDASTPVTMARHVAASLPRCRAVYYPDEGHLVAARHWDEIVSALVP
jgi:pimeloyl-ACP methyl ester carboxylesterase